MKTTIALLAIAACLLTSPAHSEPINVTVTIFPLADLVKKVGGDLVEVHTLLRPGQGPHSFEPTPGAAKKIERSDMVVMAGFGLDNWLEKLVKLGGKGSDMIVDCSKAVKNRVKGGGNHGHGGVNPHYWLDPSIMADVADMMGRRLASRIPDKADEIKKRTESVKADLLKLDREIAAMLSESKTGFVSIHNSWVYFARRYGLRQIGVIKEAPGREPSAKHIAELARKMKSGGAGKTVLVEPQFSARLGEMLAKETGATVVTVDPIGGVEGRDDYFLLMRWNAKRFAQALK